MKKNELQPRIVFVGELKNLTAYITLIDRKYFFDDPFKAVEFCMHMYLALNLQYPLTCRSVWTFLQKFIFMVNTPYDLNLASLITINHDLLKLIK